MGINLALAWLAIRRWELTDTELTLLVTGLSVAVAIWVTSLEWLHPNTSLWRPDLKTVRVDVLHLLLSQTLPVEVFNALFRSALLGGAVWLSNRMGGELWHYSDLLWRLHATHHSSPKLYWLAGARFHPLDNLVANGLHFSSLLLLGCGPEVLALFAVFLNVNGPFQHSNIKLKLGWISYLISTAEVHRWHHSQDMKEGNSNFGGYLIVWDIVFGTFFHPKDREVAPDKLGLNDMPGFPKDYLGQLLAPLRWKKLRSDATSEKAP